MNNKLVSTAVIAGLLSGISLVQAEEAKHETATKTAKAPTDPNSCKGVKAPKDSCKGVSKKNTATGKKIAKKEKMACGGKNACGGKDAAKNVTKE